MNPVANIQAHSIDVAAIPELSRLAWERLMSRISPATQSGSGLTVTGLPIRNLPGSQHLIAFPTDDWVMLYENLREKIERKQRTQGHVQTGVFYTPAWVARYLTQQSLGQYLGSVFAEIQQQANKGNWELVNANIGRVQQLRILDPACGTGVFLCESLRLLMRFYRDAQALCTERLEFHPVEYILQHQLYGIDIDAMSVMITQLRLAQWAWRLGNGSVISEHSLCPQQVIVGDTLAEGVCSEPLCWDFILGNPPYVSETRKQSKRFKALQQDEKRYYRAKMDLCDAFVMWSVEHLTGHGQLALVLPEYWTQRSSSYALRTQLWQQGQLQEFWRFGADKVFKNAPGHHPSLLIWRKKPSHSVERTQRVSMGVVTNTATLSAEQLQSVVFTLDESSGKLLYGNPVELALLQKLACLPPLLNAQEIQQGIVIPQGRLKKADAQRLSAHLQEPVYENAGVFLLDEEKIHQLGLTDAERQLLKPYYFPAGFRLFQGFQEVQAQVYIIYTDRENKKLIETYPQHYPSLRAHLDYYRAINTSAFAPYGLHRPRQPQWFEDERKILCPRQVRVPAFAVVSFTAYVNEGFYSIRPACEDPHYLCALFNSKLAWFWFYHHKRKGNRLQIDKEVLSVFPRPPQQPGMDLDAAKQLAIELSQHFDRDKWQCLNELIYQLYKLEPVEIDWIENAWQTIAGAE